MRRGLFTVFVMLCGGCRGPSTGPYLFLWAGDADQKASDFLAVIDANPASSRYGAILTSIPTGAAGTHPHHTESEMPANGHLPAFSRRSMTWRDSAIPTHSSGWPTATYSAPFSIGQTRRALRAYRVVPLVAFDRAVSTTTDMDEKNLKATSEWVQFWRLSDLTLLRSIALTPGPRGDEHRLTGEPRLLPDGKCVYIHTFNCGRYLLRDVDRPDPVAKFVTSFKGKNCGVPILTGHYWLQTVPDAHALVALDISNAEQPREGSRLKVGDDEALHWTPVPRGTVFSR